MPTRYEFYIAGDDASMSCDDDEWGAQSFTPSVTHDLTSVKALIYRVNNPGIVTVSIRAVDGAGKPTDADLASATFDGDALTLNVAGEWKEIAITGVRLQAGTTYAKQLKPANAAPAKLRWLYDSSSSTYGGGKMMRSSGGDASWEDWAAAYDTMFEEWGDPVTPMAGFNPALAELML